MFQYIKPKLDQINKIIRRLSTNTKTYLNKEDLILWNKKYNGFNLLNLNEKEYLVETEENDNFSLKGLALAVKDNICTREYPTTCSSLMLKDFEPGYNATPIEKLKKNGMIIVGKTNMDEFGMGSNNQNSYFGKVINPHESYLDDLYSAGGSSGGSASAVYSKMCYAALGSDTGGSVRLPSSYCGIVGFKPSYGRISRFGLISYASSLDTIGIMGRTIFSVNKIFESVEGVDNKDSSSIDYTGFNSRDKSIKNIKIGIPNQYFLKEIDPKVKAAWEKSIEKLQQGGAQIINIDLKHTKFALSSYYIIALAEASSNLAKYDGVQYGFNADKQLSFEEKIKMNRDLAFGDEVKRRILLGTHVLSKNAFEEYFIKAQKIRTLVIEDFNHAFEQCDIILSPTTFSMAPSFKHLSNLSPVDSYLNDVFTTPSSLAGLPAISLPYSKNLNEKPIGIQLVAQRGNDYQVLRTAEELSKMLW